MAQEAYQNINRREKAERERSQREKQSKTEQDIDTFGYSVSRLVQYMEYTVYLLLVIAMILMGFFIRTVAGGLGG